MPALAVGLDCGAAIGGGRACDWYCDWYCGCGRGFRDSSRRSTGAGGTMPVAFEAKGLDTESCESRVCMSPLQPPQPIAINTRPSPPRNLPEQTTPPPPAPVP